jgi:hypothetical protein
VQQRQTCEAIRRDDGTGLNSAAEWVHRGYSASVHCYKTVDEHGVLHCMLHLLILHTAIAKAAPVVRKAI